MSSREKANKFISSILEDYYKKAYFEVFFQGKNSKLASYYQTELEAHWQHNAKVILELGAGEGEHLKFVQNPDKLVRYIALDLRSKPNGFQNKLPFEWMQADAEHIPLPDNSVDRVVATCLLLHVNNPLAVMLETKRILRDNGEFSFLLPADPGLMVRIGRYFLTKPKMRKNGIENPSLVYALDHPNHVGSLLTMIEATFPTVESGGEQWKLKFNFRPFRLRSWNLNLFIVAYGNKSINTNS